MTHRLDLVHAKSANHYVSTKHDLHIVFCQRLVDRQHAVDVVEDDGSDAALLVFLARTGALHVEGVLSLVVAATLAARTPRLLRANERRTVDMHVT